MYDIIVVGAGATGCTAAKTLSENGYKVLLVEKFKMPRYKSCSGRLIKKSVDLVQEYFGAAVLDSVMCTPTENRGMIFTNDKGKVYQFGQSGFRVILWGGGQIRTRSPLRSSALIPTKRCGSCCLRYNSRS